MTNTTTNLHRNLRVTLAEVTVDATDLRVGDFLPGVGTVTKNGGPTMDLGVEIETMAYDAEADRNRYETDYYTGTQTIVRQSNPGHYGSVPVEFVGEVDTARANYNTHYFCGEEGRCGDCDSRPSSAGAYWPCGMPQVRI